MDNNNSWSRILNLSKRVRDEAKELDKLPGSALVAVLGGSIVIGAEGHGLFWIPAAMSGSMFVYRTAVTVFQYLSNRKAEWIAEIREVRQELMEIDQSPLSLEHKQQLGSAVLTNLPLKHVSTEHIALEHKDED